MSQVQSAGQMPSIDAKLRVERATHTSTEAFQNPAGPPYLVDLAQHHQQYLLPHCAIAQETSLHEQVTALALLSGDALAQLSLEFPRLGCDLYSTAEITQQILHQQAHLDDINSPDSLSSASSFASQDSFQNFSIDSRAVSPSQYCSPSSSERTIRASPNNTHLGNMVDQRYPGTPQQGEDEYQGFDQLIRHNNGPQYPMGNGFHPGSGPGTEYGSPATRNQWLPEGYHSRNDSMNNQYDWQGSHQPQYQGNFPIYPQYGRLPSHPLQAGADFTSGMMQPQRSRAVPGSEPRSTPPPRTKKAKTKAKADVPSLTAPLSVLTKDYDVPIRDMLADHVNRPLDKRMKEVADKGGRVPRPMNSFMLYRSAYSERTKRWAIQNNHQVISSISGASWPMEPASVREYYTDLAKQERDNHQKAHPGYKFSPSKANTTSKKRKSNKASDDEAEFASDSEYMASGMRRSAPPPRSRRPEEEMHYQRSQPYMDDMGNFYPAQQPMNPSFQYPLPARPLPRPMAGPTYETPGHYYAQVVHPPPHQGHGRVDDIRIGRTPVQPVQQSVPSGLPGANHDELFIEDYSQPNLQGMGGNDLVDPNLNFEPTYGNGVFTDQGFNELNDDILAQQAEQPVPTIEPSVETEGQPWENPSGNSDDSFRDWLENANK